MTTTEAAGAVPAASVLIVDDNAANLLALEAVLAPIGAEIVGAASGQEALRQVLRHDFALILIDVRMAGLDGYQTISLIRQRERSRNVPVIFLTAHYNDTEHTRRGYELGAIDYVIKPYDPEILRAKVGALVALYKEGQLAERTRNSDRLRLTELFVAVLGHDLRNPLNAIMLSLEMMTRDPTLPDNHRRNAERADSTARRMQRMIADILDMTRGELGGGIPTTLRPANLEAICSGVVDELGAAHPTRRLQVQINGNVNGNWDADRLAQVVSNLVANALQNSTTDPIRVTVTGADENVTMDVHNQGSPIPPAKLPLLFERFQRGHKTSEGLGLGLYIVREIARAHGGTVEARSTAADGTSFIVTLPRHGLSSTSVIKQPTT